MFYAAKWRIMLKTFTIILIVYLLFNISFLNVLLQNNKSLIKTTISRKQTVFCMVLTTPKGFEKQKPQTILSVWGYKCDKIKFISLIPDSMKNESDIIDLNSLIMQPKDFIVDQYSKLTNKVFLAFKQIFRDFGNYDWYLKTDDDTFIEMDNLRNFLSDKNPKSPITYGYDFKVIVDKGYHSGGAGYLISHESFQRLGFVLTNQKNFCKISGIEDIDVGKCLRKLNVFPKQSVDEYGRERFFPFGLKSIAKEIFPKWIYKYAANPMKNGSDCCSDNFISFHYMSPKDMLLLDFTIKRLTDSLNKNTFGQILKKPKFKEILDAFSKLSHIDNLMVDLVTNLKSSSKNVIQKLNFQKRTSFKQRKPFVSRKKMIKN